MTARRYVRRRQRRRRRDAWPGQHGARERRGVMGLTPRSRGLAGDRSRWGVVIAAIVIGCLDVIALAVVLVHSR